MEDNSESTFQRHKEYEITNTLDIEISETYMGNTMATVAALQ